MSVCACVSVGVSIIYGSDSERMLGDADEQQGEYCHHGDEDEQQGEYCHHGDEDASWDPRSVETGSYSKRRNSMHISLHRSMRLFALAVFVGLDIPKEDV